MSFSRIFSILDSLISFLLDGCVFDVALKKVTSHLTKVIQRNIIPAHSSHSSSLNKSNQAKHHSSSMISASGIFFKLFPFHQLAYSRLAGKRSLTGVCTAKRTACVGTDCCSDYAVWSGGTRDGCFLGRGGGKKKGFRIYTVLYTSTISYRSCRPPARARPTRAWSRPPPA